MTTDPRRPRRSAMYVPAMKDAARTSLAEAFAAGGFGHQSAFHIDMAIRKE